MSHFPFSGLSSIWGLISNFRDPGPSKMTSSWRFASEPTTQRSFPIALADPLRGDALLPSGTEWDQNPRESGIWIPFCSSG